MPIEQIPVPRIQLSKSKTGFYSVPSVLLQNPHHRQAIL